jgi:hypothetical protein
MLRSFAEWIWRLALLAAVLLVAWEIALLREDLANPGDAPVESETGVTAS